jgi:hypothetical protein
MLSGLENPAHILLLLIIVCSYSEPSACPRSAARSEAEYAALRMSSQRRTTPVPLQNSPRSGMRPN